MPQKKDIRSEYLVHKNFYQEKFYKLYLSEMGSFFDMLTNSVQSSLLKVPYIANIEAILPRLEAYYRKNQKNWDDSNLIFTNYFRIIPELYSTFSLGEGVQLVFPENEKQDKFKEFWDDNKLNEKLENLFEESLATGYAGGYFIIEDEKLKFQKIGFANYYPVRSSIQGYSTDDINLIWIVSTEDKPKNLYAYVINYKKNKDGKITITHNVYDYSKSGGVGTQKHPEILSQLDTDGTLVEDGTEDNKFKSMPIFLLKNPREDRFGFGQSVFTDIVGHCQDLSINETISSNELQDHFASKVAIPESAVTKNSDGTAQLRSLDYIVVGKNSTPPTYITKDNPFFEPLFKKISVTKNSLAVDTKIPIELLDKEGRSGQEKVELAKIRTKPFTKRITSYRGAIESFINDLAKFVYEYHNVENKLNFEIKFPPIFDEDILLVKEDLRKDLDKEVISKKQYLRDTRPTKTEEEIDEIAKEAEDDFEIKTIEPTNPINNTGNRL